MGRRTWIKPAFGHAAWIQMVYQTADSASRPQAFGYERPNSSTTSLLRGSQLRFDDFGRVGREARDTSSGWSYSSHAFDRAGNLAASSQWQAGTPSQWTYFQNFDPFGRAEKVVAPGGKTLSSTYYGDWGVQRWFYVGVSRSGERMRYTGQERDQNQSGTVDDLDYMHARYCSPNLGRFLSPDPQLGQIAAPQSWNRYSYAANNPMNYTDPTGEYVTTCAQDDAECNKNAAAFEAARQKLKNGGDKKFEAAAGAYGDPGVANGVTVSFEETGT